MLVVPADNPGRIESPRDLAHPGLKLVLASPDVPIGNYARQIIDRLAADPPYGAAFRPAVFTNLVSSESNVRGVLVKVEFGEADALVSGAKVRVVAIPDAANVIATYPIGVVAASRNQPATRAFVELVRGPVGRRLLADAAFDAAP